MASIVSSITILSNGLFHIVDGHGRESYTSDTNDVLALLKEPKTNGKTRTQRKQAARAKTRGRSASARAR